MTARKNVLLLALISIILASSRAAADLHLPADVAECTRWAAAEVESALREANALSEARIAVELHPGADIPFEGFELTIREGAVRIVGGDAVGAMYGLLELAEQIRNGGARN